MSGHLAESKAQTDDAFDEICEVGDGIHVIWLALTALEGADHEEVSRCLGGLAGRLRAAINTMIEADQRGAMA